jgi:maltooligosyltrehalose synthase
MLTACADPEQFLRRLRAIAPKAWIVVEKILEPGSRSSRLAGGWHDRIRFL